LNRNLGPTPIQGPPQHFKFFWGAEKFIYSYYLNYYAYNIIFKSRWIFTATSELVVKKKYFCRGVFFYPWNGNNGLWATRCDMPWEHSQDWYSNHQLYQPPKQENHPDRDDFVNSSKPNIPGILWQILISIYDALR
jgi:hypothetical protein